MLDIITYILSILITAPILASFIVYIVSMLIERNKWKAVHRVVNWTTIFYVVAVNIILKLLFNQNFFSWIVIFFLVTLTIIIIVQWKSKNDVQLTRALKLLTRMAFLLFFLLYACFMVIGIVINIFS